MMNKMISYIFLIMLISMTSASAAVDISLVDVSANYGDTIEIPINISSISNIGAVDISLTYDPTVLFANSVVNGSLISENELIERNLSSGNIDIAVASLYGITGTGSLVSIMFNVVGSGGATSQLELSAVTAYDLDNPIVVDSKVIGYGEIPTALTNSTFTATGEIVISGDISGDGKVNYIDLGMLGASYGLSLGDVGYNAASDLNGDDKVNYIDLGMLGANYGLSV